MNSLKKIIFLLLFFAGQSLFAQTSILKGLAPEYKGMKIPVYTFSDFISEEKIKIGEISFQSDGKFSCSVNLPQTGICFAEFDIYHAMIYVVPGKTYEIQLPPRKEKTEIQKRNPFFKATQVWFKIINQPADDLNLLIKSYEKEFQTLESKYFYDIYQNHSCEKFELVISKLENKFPKTTNHFFEDYKKYRIGNLEYALNQRKTKFLIDKYLGEESTKIQIPSYSDLFNQLFSNYFSFQGSSTHNKEISSLVNSGNIYQLEKYLRTNNNWNPELCRFIILKALKDAYYSGQFSKKAIINAYKQVESSSWTPKEKQIAHSVLKKITYMIVGSLAPPLQLVKKNGEKISLNQFKGKLIYLHFTDFKNPICRQHMDALKKVINQFHSELVVILVTNDKATQEDIKKWGGIYTTTDDKYKDAYQVKTFPTSYLIGRDGNLLASPALNPLNGLSRQVQGILKKEKIEQLRNSSQESSK